MKNRDFQYQWDEQKITVSKFSFRRKIVDEIDFENLENLFLHDLKEVSGNFTILQKYTKSILTTLKLVLQSGFLDENSDSIYNMLMTTFIIFGGWIYSTYVLILVSNVMMASASSETKFEILHSEVDAFCEAKNLSPELTEKIQLLYKYKFQKHYFNEEAIKMSTATSLRKEITLHACTNLISKVTLFKEIPQILFENIISCLKMEIYLANDVIIQANTVGDSMFFIAFGTANIYSPSGKLPNKNNKKNHLVKSSFRKTFGHR